MKHPLWNALPRWLLTWLVCVALSLGLAALLKVDSRWWLAALVLLLWCAILAVTEQVGRFGAMLAIWLAAFGLCLLLSDRKALTEAALAVVSRTGEVEHYGELLLLLVCAAAVLPLSALMQYYLLRAALSIVWTGLWIAAALLQWPLPRMLPAAMLPLLLLTLAETVRRMRHEPEPERRLRRALLLTLLPAVLLLGLLPAPAEPYGYPLLHSVVEAVEKLWYDMETALHYRQEGEREFGMSFNGFSDEPELGDNSEEESSAVIFANPEHTPAGAVYLFGNAWNRFDGRNWSSTLRATTADYLNWSLDTAEHIYALWRLTDSRDRASGLPGWLRSNSVFLQYRNMNVRTMFTVANTTRVFSDAERYPYADVPTGSLFDYVQTDDTGYRLYFLDSAAAARSALIAAAEGTDYDPDARSPLWGRVARDYSGELHLDLHPNTNLQRTLAARQTLIYDVYLDCTGVSARAAALAEEITEGLTGDYERVAAIAAYLQQNYAYTQTPAPVPARENFLDWLLFEGREGYCTWYATAAVLMARSVGVPARYVQGYRGELVGEAFTALGARDAHAWCECYIRGYGWVTVEATPGFVGGDVGPLTDAEPLPVGVMDPEAEPSHSAAQDAGDLPLLPDPSGMHGPGEEPEEEPESAPTPGGWLPVLIAAVLLMALAAVWLWLRARRRRRYAQADPTAKLTLDLERLLSDLRGKGYPRRAEESLQQYFERLPWRLFLIRPEEAREISELYDRTFFALRQPTEEELERHRSFAAYFRPRTLREWLTWYRLQ